MTHVSFVIPGDINLPTGGYGYARRVLALLPSCGIGISHVGLPGTFPAPSSADLAETRSILARTPASDVLMIDGLAYGAMPVEIVRRLGRRIVALVHHPLCLETGVNEARARELKQLETEALAEATRVIASSRTTAETLIAEFGVPAPRVAIAEPGTDPAPRAKGSGGAPVRLLAVGSLVPRKGYDVLIEALVPLKTLSWRLDIAGALDRSPETVRRIEAMIAKYDFGERIKLLGPVPDEQLANLYDTADLFVLASHYEGYGMVLTEAVARGLPIVCTLGGAIEQTVPEGAALKVQPDSPRALAWTLGRAIEDRKIRQALSEAGWAAAQSLPRWEDTARRIAAVIAEVAR